MFAWWLILCVWFWLNGKHHRYNNTGRRTPPVTAIRRNTAKPPWVRREIIRLKALMPAASCRDIEGIFNRRHIRHAEIRRRMTVGKTYVSEVMRRHSYEIKVERRNIKHRIPPALSKNIVWGLDLTGKGDTTGHVHSMIGIIDHGSRALLTLSALPNKNSWTLLGHMFLAIGKYGKPKAIRTDNESVFVSRVFRAGLLISGIKHQRSDLGCPWQNGRIERLFLTLKQKLDQMETDGVDSLNALLREFRFFYNHIRPHQHLQGRTPAETWVKTDPYSRPVKETLWFEAWDGLLQGFYLRR